MKTDSPIQRRASHWGTGRHRDTGRLGDPVYRACGRGPAAPRPGPWSLATTLRAPSRELFRIYTEEDYLNGVGDGRAYVIGRPARRRPRSRALLAVAAAFLLAVAVARQLALSAGNRRTTDGPFRLPAMSPNGRSTPSTPGHRLTLRGVREAQRAEQPSRKWLRRQARNSSRRVARRVSRSASSRAPVRRTLAGARHLVSRPFRAAAAAPSAVHSASSPRVASPALPTAVRERARGHGRSDFTFERR